MNKECVICGSNTQIEMHHLNHVRKIGEKVTGFARILSQLNRKQILVCKECHNKIHRGRP